MTGDPNQQRFLSCGLKYIVASAALFLGLAWPPGTVRVDAGTKEINYRYEDRPQQKKIFVYFHNTSRRPICLGPGNWPEKGILLNPGNEVSLDVDGERYFLGPENDFCPRCRKKVPPGEKVQDFFEYKSFGLKEKSELSDKKLHFSPVGVSCQ